MNELEFLRRSVGIQGAKQQELEQDRQLHDTRLVAPQIREQVAETQAAVIAQTNPSKALKVVLKGFEGYILNEYDEYELIGEEIMNKQGRARLASTLIPFVNDVTRFGNISEKEVRDLCLQTLNDLTEDIGSNWREYGIQNSSYKNLILDSLLALILITLTRSEEQGEKNWLSKVILESIGTKQQGKKESGNWKSFFKI